MAHIVSSDLHHTIIGTYSLQTMGPRYPIINPITIVNILSLRSEISVLCALYSVDVAFQFDSLQDIPAQIVEDLMTLNISGAAASKNPKYWGRLNHTAADTQLLLNFLQLVRTLMHHFGPHRVMQIIVDFDHMGLLKLGPKPEVERANRPMMSTNPQVNKSNFQDLKHVPTRPSAAKRTKSNVRFNPFASRKPLDRRHGRLELDLNDENYPELLLAEKPMRMRRRIRIGLPIF
ncbi:hypothetical protein FRC10_005875 [Ceratobasidium sp. 414]|nr:hypothetical protein FRC10_005875 [Ceratobasidium sp. 414]